MYKVLHIPTGTYLFNMFLNKDWEFRIKSIADQLLENGHPLNLKTGTWRLIKETNSQVDWTNFLLTEFEIVEI